MKITSLKYPLQLRVVESEFGTEIERNIIFFIKNWDISNMLEY